MLLAASMQTDIVVGGFDPIDVTYQDYRTGISILCEEALGIWITSGGGFPRGEGLQYRGDFLTGGEGLFELDALFDSCDGFAEALGFDWLNKIVERMELESFNRVFVVGGDEDGHRHIGKANRFDYVEASAAGHLDIEKQEIDGRGFECGNNFLAISALGG